MKRYLLNCLYFIIPFCIYLAIIFLIDPFNYNNLEIVKVANKEKIAEDVQPHLYKLIKYENNPTNNILLGDSRANRLGWQITAPNWTNLTFGGGSIKEVTQAFWYASEMIELDTVLIGLGLNLYNKYNKRFWVEETIGRKNNFFSYAFSRFAFKATKLSLQSLFSDEEIDLQKPPMSKEDFWVHQVNETGVKFYKKMGYPLEYYQELEKISKYCHANNIQLIFFIPPTHVDLQGLKSEYKLDEYEQKFLSDLQGLGNLYDFDFESDLTRNKEDYGDPMHFEWHIGEKVHQDIFGGTSLHSRFYKKSTITPNQE